MACTHVFRLPTTTRFLPDEAAFPFLGSFPFHFSWFLLGLSSFPDLPVHSPNGQGVERPSAPCSGCGLNHHTHAISAPGSRAQSGQKQEGILLPSLSCSCPSGREPEDAQEQPAAALCLQGGQAVEAAAGNQALPQPRLRGTRAGRGSPLQR